MDRYGDREAAKPSQKIYISNLSMDTNESELRKSFEPHGTIVDVNLKHKDTGIVFAFIEFDSVESAQKAVDAMNKTTLGERELKVEFARGRGDRNDRGGYRGDRDDRGFRGGRDNFDRRRDGGDRPRGCFNCGEEGHFAKECPKPRVPREFNRDRNDSRGGNYRSDRGGDRGDRGDRNSGRDYRGENERRGDYRKKEERRKSRSRSRSGEKKKEKKRKSSDSSSNSY